MTAMFIETEPTPNPATVKFLPGQTVMPTGTRDFAEMAEAEGAPLAAALFSLGDVAGVFFGRDFVSVTAADPGGWRTLKPRVLAVMLDHFASGAPLFTARASAADIAIDETIPDNPEDADVIAQIKDLIETRVRPAVARDGGDILYKAFDRGIVYIAMHGACSGCPSSSATLKRGVETLLKHYVPEVIEVRAS